MNLRSLALLTILSSVVLPYAASQMTAPTLAASALTAVPPLVPYSGQVKGRTGQVSATFLIYKNQQGGDPLFAESQVVAFDEAGHYSVQLGAANPNGLPSDLFSSGEARWLEVQVAGEESQPRVLLASVPYALKAADSATLGGLPASAFVLAGSNVAVANAKSAVIAPDLASTVTTTGGTANKVAKFSGSNTIVNSLIYDNGTEVGIGTTSPTATLTVTGSSTFNGGVLLSPVGTAKASGGFDSQQLTFNASAYNSSTATAVYPRFKLQAEIFGNDTSAPGGRLNLLSSSGTAGVTETGLYFNTDGTIHFAAGQVFGGKSTSGVAFNGTSTSGTGVEGTSSTGSGVVGNSSGTTGDLAGVTGINGSVGGVGVLGAGSSLSAIAQLFRSAGYGAGTWGDTEISNSTRIEIGALGTADDNIAGVFQNNSLNAETLFADNDANSPTAHAAVLGGNYGHCDVDTSGDLTCDGTKSAVVPVDNNTRKVALYAVESPENWFEDFGTGQLSNGIGTVTLEPTFAQTINVDVDYHVFLTPRGDSKGLYISQTTSTSFEVRESGGGRSTLAFDYRIVARRKGYETVRLADKTKERDRSQSPLTMAAQRAKQMK